ncbi:hypothetical protein [Rhodococcus sp. LB1]|uniref:hypothetical protein n=1 Tax=Rhodococcus sp. LB1 TaxID=1807499 RepID=UPI000B1CF12F|nr:hypothetical protein [Rhodococcus sp. LB1]
MTFPVVMPKVAKRVVLSRTKSRLRYGQEIHCAVDTEVAGSLTVLSSVMWCTHAR